MPLYPNVTGFETRDLSPLGSWPSIYPLFVAVNDFHYDADVTKLTWRVAGGGVTAPTARGVNAPGGALTYTLGAVNDGEVGYQDVGQVAHFKPGTYFGHQVHTAIPTPTAIGWMFGWLQAQGSTLVSAPQDGIVVYSAPGESAVEIRVYVSGSVEQTVTTNAVIGTDPVAIALTLIYNDNTNQLFARLAVNNKPVTLNGSHNAVAITTAHIPANPCLASGGILQPAADAASVVWRHLLYATEGSRFYGLGTFGFGDDTGSGSGSGGDTSSGGGGSGGGPGSGSTGATE